MFSVCTLLKHPDRTRYRDECSRTTTLTSRSAMFEWGSVRFFPHRLRGACREGALRFRGDPAEPSSRVNCRNIPITLIVPLQSRIRCDWTILPASLGHESPRSGNLRSFLCVVESVCSFNGPLSGTEPWGRGSPAYQLLMFVGRLNDVILRFSLKSRRLMTVSSVHITRSACIRVGFASAFFKCDDGSLAVLSELHAKVVHHLEASGRRIAKEDFSRILLQTTDSIKM
jgi:hypothetical protein